MPTANFPLRHEDEATGLTAAVFQDVRRRMSFVPALFKALAVDPPALELAWLQARTLYDDPDLPAAAARLAQTVRPDLAYRASEPVRRAVEPFMRELPTMLLVVTSLGLTLDGDLPLRPRPRVALPHAESVPESAVPELRKEHPLFEEIRAVYGTEHLPSIFRALAARGLLDEPWREIGPFLASRRGLELAAGLTATAEDEARRFPEVAVFDAESARPVLDQFRIALPRNLLFATAASAAPSMVDR